MVVPGVDVVKHNPASDLKFTFSNKTTQSSPLCTSPGLADSLPVWRSRSRLLVFATRRGSEGGGRDRRAAPEQPDPAGELPEADGAAAGPDRDREPDGAGPGESEEKLEEELEEEQQEPLELRGTNKHQDVLFSSFSPQEFIREGCLYKLTKKGLQQRMFFLVRRPAVLTSDTRLHRRNVPPE